MRIVIESLLASVKIVDDSKIPRPEIHAEVKLVPQEPLKSRIFGMCNMDMTIEELKALGSFIGEVERLAPALEEITSKLNR